MAVPSVLQMIFGVPKITIEPDVEESENSCFLVCKLYNEPIRNRILTFLRVSRDPAHDVIAYFTIDKQGSGETVCLNVDTEIKTQREVASQRISLPPSLLPAAFPIVVDTKTHGVVYVMRRVGQDMLLKPGVYIAKVRVLSGSNIKRAVFPFIVQDTFPFAAWLVNS